MEIKATLNKPYTEKQRIDFIVQNNHKLGYQIKETELALEAWGYTEEEIEEQQKQKRNEEIDSKIKELNEMSVPEMLNNNIENLKIYRDVIAGLEAARL